MSFLQTVAGQHLSDMGMRALRKYTRKTYQYVVGCPLLEAEGVLQHELVDNGSRYIDKVLDEDHHYVVMIFEREK